MHERSAWLRDCNVVERIETSRERCDWAPGTVSVPRDSDTPFVGDRDVPRGDGAVASAGCEYDVPETISILESDGTSQDAVGREHCGSDGAAGVGFVDPCDDRRTPLSDDDMWGPDRLRLPVERDDSPVTPRTSCDPERLLVIAPLREDERNATVGAGGGGGGVRVAVRR
jgi:hypothetical protein